MPRLNDLMMKMIAVLFALHASIAIAAEPSGATRINGLRLLDDTITRAGGVGDNWHMSWAANDVQYSGLCDGTGLPGMKHKQYNSVVFEIHGDPPKPTFKDIPTFPDLLNESPEHFSRYYGFGIFAHKRHIYQFLSTPRVRFPLQDCQFVGAKLIYSDDDGKTWRNQNGSTPVVWEKWDDRSRENMVFWNEPGEAFSLLSVLQMGKDYGENRDGYVYVYTPNGNTEETMRQLVMFRVKTDKLLKRGAYEYFVKRDDDGGAEWSSKIEDRGPTHEFPTGWVNKFMNPYAWMPSVTYNAPLGVYLMTSWGMGTDAKGDWFKKPSYLGFWAADKPWGPWRQIYENESWTPGGDKNARCYQPQISPKWISPDGKSFWLVWTDFQEKKSADGKNISRPYYGFNMQKVEIEMKDEGGRMKDEQEGTQEFSVFGVQFSAIGFMRD